MILSEVQAPVVGPSGGSAASSSPAAAFTAAGGRGGGTIPPGAPSPPVFAVSSPLAAALPEASASHILSQFPLTTLWKPKESAEEDNEDENSDNDIAGGLTGLRMSDQAKAGAPAWSRHLPFGWVFSLVRLLRACWIRIVPPAASWVWLVITTTTSPVAGDAAGVSSESHPQKHLPTLHHVTVHESRTPLLPPGLLYLAGLTLFALVIHPDGYTWVALRRVRAFLSLTIRATTTVWSIVLEDYGAIVSSIMALSTFAALFFLAFVLRKTLSPKPNPAAANKQKQVARKKRRSGKGNHHQHHQHPQLPHGRRTHQRVTGGGGRCPVHADDDSSSARDGVGPSLSTNMLPALLEDVPLSPPLLQSTTAMPPPAAAADGGDESIRGGSGHSLSSGGVAGASGKVSSRERIMTEDTDELSCDSTSGRSTPTMAVDLSSQHSNSSSNVAAASSRTHRPASNHDAPIPTTMTVPTPKRNARKDATGNGRRKQPDHSVAQRVQHSSPAAAKPAFTNATSGPSTTSSPGAKSAQSPNRWETSKPRSRGHLQVQVPSQPQQPTPPSRQPRQRQPITAVQVQQPRPSTGKQPRTPDHGKVRSPKLAAREGTSSGATPRSKKQPSATKTSAPTPTRTPSVLTSSSLARPVVDTSTAQRTTTPTVYYSPPREATTAPGLGDVSTSTPFGTPLSFSSNNQQSSFFSTAAWDPKPGPLSSPWAASGASAAPTKTASDHATVLDLSRGLGELTLGAPAAPAFSHPTSSFASIRPPPGLSLPSSGEPLQPLSLSSVLSGLTADGPASDDSAATTFFPLATPPPASFSRRRKLRENPFEDDTTAREDGCDDDDLMIEAELQELGGRIAGSVLDS